MSNTLDLAVMIGRFRIFHNGHKSVVDLALQKAKRVLLLVGSANRSRDTDGNEFTAEEAAEMIRRVYPKGTESGDRVMIRLIDDVMYDEQDLHWIMGVQRQVALTLAARRPINFVKKSDARVGLIGFSKDQSSYYLKKFPQWASISAPGYKHNGKIVSATDLRNEFFYSNFSTQEAIARISNRIPSAVAAFLDRFAKDNAAILEALREEREFLTKYKEDHQFRGKLDADGKPLGLKYAPTHTTVDAILIQSGHVLLIRRKMNPGKGKWALPGGFVEPHENITDATTRELKEETKIALSLNVLKLAFRKRHVFAGVGRSGRGRIITHVSLYLLNDRAELPAVEGGDDAAKAEWVPLGELDPTQMHDDHWHLIMKMIGSMIGD
jgi:bifunctional NMN adenylyltransferase/nudix hydrolase